MVTNISNLMLLMGTLHAGIVVKSFVETNNLDEIGGTYIALIRKADLYSDDLLLKRTSFIYTIDLKTTNETNLELLLSTLKTNLYKLTTYQTITSYTRPSNLCNVRIFNVGEFTKNNNTGEVTLNIKLLMEWE